MANGLVSDISPITQLLRTAGQERRTTDLISGARAGDAGALDRLLAVNPGAYKNIQAEQMLQQKQMASNAANQAYSVYQAPPEQRRAILTDMANQARAEGNENKFYKLMDAASLDDATLNAVLIQEMQAASQYGWEAPLLQDSSKIRGLEGDVLFKDSKGNIFGTSSFIDPNTQQTQGQLYDVTGKGLSPQGELTPVSVMGQTLSEKVTQIGAEATAKSRSEENEKARQGYIKAGLQARGMIPKTKGLIEINNLIRTGKIASAQKKMGDVFGTTDVDLGKFNALAGKMVLDNIRSLGANPTEGERAFLLQITPSIEQGKEVNDALLKDLLAVQEAQVRRAKWFSNNPGKTVEQYFLETNESDFVSGERRTVKWADK